ncbi:unnamed protein product, partial [Medioppia subpectinata]
NFNEYKSQVLAVVRDGSAGDPKCTDETAVEVNKMLDGFADDVLNMICPKEYSSDADVADKCQPIVELTPKPVAPLSPRPKSLLMPLSKLDQPYRQSNFYGFCGLLMAMATAGAIAEIYYMHNQEHWNRVHYIRHKDGSIEIIGEEDKVLDLIRKKV